MLQERSICSRSIVVRPHKFAPTRLSVIWGWARNVKCRRTTHLGSFVLAVLFAAGLLEPAPRAHGEGFPAQHVASAGPDTSSYELCIEQSPVKAGKVSPGSGTHRFSANTVVALSAEPQRGYQFAYWLGDVADPRSQRTIVHVNTPKIIVAVFRPADEDPFEKSISGGGGGGGGGTLLPTTTDLSIPGWSASGGGGKSRTQTVFVPVVATPEPATIILFGLGALALRRRTRRA